ncbi:hypothetical protein pipiens_000400, partial [Culex pipiens pipiens]
MAHLSKLVSADDKAVDLEVDPTTPQDTNADLTNGEAKPTARKANQTTQQDTNSRSSKGGGERGSDLAGDEAKARPLFESNLRQLVLPVLWNCKIQEFLRTSNNLNNERGFER